MAKTLGKIWILESESPRLTLSYNQRETAQLYEEASMKSK
jgi:hypothetical protein